MADKYIDLHLHLDGAVTVGIARKLADLQGISLPSDDDKLSEMLTVPSDCKSLNDFLKCFDLPLSLMQTEEGISEAVCLVCDEQKAQNVIYAEIRFAPQLHTEKGLTQEQVIKAALKGLSETDLKANLILCFMRMEGNESANEETLELAKKYLTENGGVVAVDLAGAEALFPVEKYKKLFEKAKENRIPFTIHAGEAAGAESVRLAVEYGAARIGHGVRSYEDPELIGILGDRGICLEMCPTSNRQTHAVEDMSKYPLMDYLHKGLCVTINTDDPGIEGTTLADEFKYIEKVFGLTESEKQKILVNAINSAFTSEEVKAALKEEVR